MTVKLSEIAKLIRSKNAGPFILTIDIMFEDETKYSTVKQSNAITKSSVSQVYKLTIDKVDVEYFDAANSIKISIPRPHISGSFEDSDVFGGQQYGPLVDLEIN
ncbi:MAG: DUF4387 domain-containing protein [Proteobacteria bacterium]|nr:DUF4387 domain-containing protein [Pseudomonadota bacterium]